MFNKKVLLDFITVFFAVFLGLFVNQVKESFDNKKLANHSKENIRIEFKDNFNKINRMLIEQKNILRNIDSINNLPEDKKFKNERNTMLVFDFTNSASWETAKITQSLIYMDINTVQELSEIYKLQNFYEKIVKEFVLNTVRKEQKKQDKLNQTERLLKLIIPIEENLKQAYISSLDSLLVD